MLTIMRFQEPQKKGACWAYMIIYIIIHQTNPHLSTLRLNTLQAAPGIPFLADQRPPSPPRLNTTCAMTSVRTFIKGCRRSVQNLQNLSHVLQCHLMLLSDEPCFKVNLFLKKMQVPEWGKQWYNGLRPENPGVQTLAKLQWTMSHQRKTRLLGGWFLVDCTIRPLVSLDDGTLAKKELSESTFANLYFRGMWPRAEGTQLRLFAKVYGTSSTINYHNYGSLAV